MKTAILGTGMVGQALAGKFVALGHEVTLGSRDPEAAIARTDVPWPGATAFADWHRANADVDVQVFSSAATGADLIVLAVQGAHAVEALSQVAEDDRARAVIIDVTNAMDISGSAPRFGVGLDDSLGEQLQRAFPEARIVKTLNTVGAPLMAAPEALADGDHTLFLSGKDDEAKAVVREILHSFGWEHVHDLGGIETARGPELYMNLFGTLAGSLATPLVNVRVMHAPLA
jgi:hypothetical protein